MKYFSLFNGEEVHINPEEKVIPEDTFSTLISAVEIVDKAKIDAEKHIEKTKLECEKLKKEAYEAGYQDGLEKLNKAILEIDKEIKNLRDEFSKKVLPVALKAAKKILGDELKLHPDRVTDIVIQALKPVTQHHMIKIIVSKEDFENIEKEKDRIKQMLEQVKVFSIHEREDIEPGGCIIETEAGIINAQLDNQWRALEAAFQTFRKE